MRLAFVEKLTELAEKDKNVWLLTGDLGFSVFENFIERFPDQYLNVGVSEQNLMGIAAGMAMLGKRPFVYSISTFATMRPYEQIRNDICYQNLPVTIIGGGSTFSYSTFGCTHFPLEDVAIMRALPNIKVTVPGDPMEVRKLLDDIYKQSGPAYMRIAKKGEPIIHADFNNISLGKISEIRSGSDAVVIVSGRQLPSAITAHEILSKEGLNLRVISCHTLKPIDELSVLKVIKESKVVVTCEEHSVIGGLGTIISEIIAKNGIKVPFKILGVPDEFPKGVGSQDYFLKRYNITTEGIVETVHSLLNG